ncbi:MAG: hypothetical protein R3F07_02945 [Opitutaceae bacterium]
MTRTAGGKAHPGLQELEIHGPQPQWSAMDETFDLPADTMPGYHGSRACRAIRDWMNAARSGSHRCRNTPQSTVDTRELIDTIYRSSREGRRIECAIGGESSPAD